MSITFKVKEIKEANNERLLEMYEIILTESVKREGFNTTLNKNSDRIKQEIIERLNGGK